MYQVATKRRAAALQQRSQRLVPLSGRITHGFKRSQTGYVSANEGILPLCLLDSSHCLLSLVISCRVMWRQRSNRGQSDPPRSSLPHLLALTPARPGSPLSSSSFSPHPPPPQSAPVFKGEKTKAKNKNQTASRAKRVCPPSITD